MTAPHKLLLVFVLAATAPVAAGREVVIAVTGETHGALEPCNCPLEPDGGLPRRVSFLNALRTSEEQKGNDVLLLDVGGNAAGGPYDTRPFQSDTALIRTDTIFQTMHRLGYDAVACSDDELAWGGANIERWAGMVPFILSNPVSLPIETVAASRTVSKASITVEVYAVSHPPLLTVENKPAGMTLADASSSLRSLLDKSDPKALKILICHMGETESRRMAAEFSDFALILNAGSKRSTLPSFYADGVPVVQFSFESRRVPVVRFNLDGPSPRFLEVASPRLSDEIPDDPVAANDLKKTLAAIRTARGHSAKKKVTVFEMPLCPYARSFEQKFLPRCDTFSNWMEVDFRFLVTADDAGRLRSLNGNAELDESRRRAAIREFFPAALPAYMHHALQNPDASWQESARAAGIIPTRIDGALKTGEADEFLRTDMAMAASRNIRSSPTVLVDNVRVDLEPLPEKVLSMVCAGVPRDQRPPPCLSLPECFSHSDCAMPRMDVECMAAGTTTARCKRSPAPVVPLALVYPGWAIMPVRDRMKDALVQLFPGLQVTEYEADSAKGRELLKLYPFDRLPALFLREEVTRTRAYRDIASTLHPIAENGTSVVSPDASGAAFYFKRPRLTGSVTIFVPMTSQPGREAISAVLQWMKQHQHSDIRLDFSPVLLTDEKTHELIAPGGPPEVEQALRFLAVSHNSPSRLRSYLEALVSSGNTGYWEEPLQSAGLDAMEVKTQSRSEAVHTLAMAIADLCRSIRCGGNISILVNNQEMLSPANAGELSELLDLAVSVK